METLTFKTNINCGNCIKSVTPYLNSLEEVELWKVDTGHPDKLLQVTADEGSQALVMQAVQQAGFAIEPL